LKIYQWLDSFKSQSKNQLQLKFLRQIGAEQEIQSHIYGVKGKIDSTCVFEDAKNQEKVTAVELKTGKYESQSHKYQVMVYLSILGEVFSNPNDKHLLVYIMNDKQNVSIKTMDNEITSLIQQRNLISKYRKSLRMGTYELPDMIRDDNK
jgi:CRISPR/Cas system-associated exonuclease Cas4 (RecB family)